MDANSFVLVSWYFDIWNLFSREFVFAGCRVIGFERIARTACDAVGEVMVWIAITVGGLGSEARFQVKKSACF